MAGWEPEYATYEAAMEAVEVAVQDTLDDQPNLKEHEDDVFHDMIQSIMAGCSPELARELAQRNDIAIPDYLRGQG